MKTILFCRVSSKEQEDTGYSLDAQEKLLKEYSRSKGFITEKVFRISEGATEKQIRKLFQEMLKYLNQNKIEIICCEKIDRLTRNPRDALQIDDWLKEKDGRAVHFIKESLIIHRNTPAHEKFMWDIKVAVARFYSNNLSEEVKKGQKEKIAQGWLPTHSKLGYQTSGEEGHKIHIIDSQRAPYIKRLFELYATGNYSSSVLTDLMYAEGLRSRKGKKVSRSQICYILSDPLYYGCFRWKGDTYSGKHQPIISKELFNSVQDILHGRKNPQFKKHTPVFKAKVKCEGCGGLITWEIHKGHWYGHCSGYRSCTHRTWYRQESIEGKLFKLFNNVVPKDEEVLHVLDKALEASCKKGITQDSHVATEAQSALAVAEKRLEAIYEDKIDKKISVEFYEQKFQTYTKDKENALKILNHDDSKNPIYYQAAAKTCELGASAQRIYESPKATTEDKRLLLSKIFSNLSINAEEIRVKYTFSFQFLAKWMPSIKEIIEPWKMLENKGQMGDFYFSCPTLLAFQDSFRTYDWEKALGDIDVFMKETEYLLSLIDK